MPAILGNCDPEGTLYTKASTKSGVDEISNDSYGLTAQSFVRVYQVLADTTDDTEKEILETTGLPELWDKDTATGAFCFRRTAREINSIAKLWNVICEYSTQYSDYESNNAEATCAKIRWRWTQEFEEEAMTTDLEGTPVRNSAGEPLVAKRQKVIPILEIERYQRALTAETIRAYVDHLNYTEWWGFPKGCVKLAGIDDQPETVNGDIFRKVIYKFKVKMIQNPNYSATAPTDPEDPEYDEDALNYWLEDTWQLKLLDHGTYFLDHSSYSGGSVPDSERFAEKYRTRFRDMNNRPTTGNLDGSGGKLESSDPDVAVYLDFVRHGHAEFADLDLCVPSPAPWTTEPWPCSDPCPEEE
jgi:hypothetical protein